MFPHKSSLQIALDNGLLGYLQESQVELINTKAARSAR